MNTKLHFPLAIVTLVLLTACSQSEVPTADVTSADAEQSATPSPQNAVAPVAAGETEGCVNEANISYLCGPQNAEDALRLGNSQWLLVSGMNGQLANNPAINGKMYLVNHEERSWEVLFPGNNPVLEQDMEMFASCPGPLDVTNFSAHGLALQSQESGPERYRLYMTSHGAREAIEVFDVDAFVKPTIKWIGCVPMPATSWTNSIAILGDGGFFATQFMDPTGSGMAGVTAGDVTGHVFEWHPGGEVTVLAGTELSGPNGIVITDDERYLFVAAFGTHEIVRFDLSSNPPAREAVSISVAPDNIRWNSAGNLYTAGGNVTDACTGPVCGTGWSVIEIVPFTMTATRVTGVDETAAMRGVSSALLVDDEIWVGTYGGERIGIMPKP